MAAMAGRSARTRSSEKHAAIMHAATDRFLERGYLGTSVDEIAAQAGVSKQTVYEHFGGKERLFSEIVVNTIDEVGQPFFDRIVEFEEDSDDLEGWLERLAWELVGVVKERRLLELRRLVIAEINRFPSLGRIYYERGPGRTIDALATRFARLDENGLLRVDDAQLAAQQFNWLVLSVPVNQAMFDPDTEFSDAEIGAYARDAVRVFLAAYGAR
jgi:TetR/AcrR family transcriptional repressor of mexJK operon